MTSMRHIECATTLRELMTLPATLPVRGLAKWTQVLGNTEPAAAGSVTHGKSAVFRGHHTMRATVSIGGRQNGRKRSDV